MFSSCVHFAVLVTVLGVVYLPRISIAAVPSGPPQDVVAVATSSRTVHVTWNDVLAAERNGVLTEYEVRYEQFTFVEIAQSLSERIAAEEEDELTLRELQEFVEYTVSVRASNEDGDGPFSAPVRVATYQDVPSSPPQNVVISANVPTQLALSWDRPPEVDINGLLTFYSVRYHRVGFNDYNFTVVNGSLQSYVLKGLDNYTLYEVFIAATTANGTGPFDSQTARTSENAPQSPPQNVTANSTTPYSIDVEWRPPDESEWNGILRGYQLRYAKIDSATMLPPSTNAWLEVTLPQANLTQYRLHGLQSSSLYCVQVAAVTVATGPHSLPVCVSTPDGLAEPSLSSGRTSGNAVTTSTVVPTPSDVSNSQRGSFVAIVAGSVVATVAVVLAALVPTVALAICRWKQIKKSRSLSHYFASTNPHEVFSDSSRNRNQTHSSAVNPQFEHTAVLAFANPAVTTPFFELQPNRAYNANSLPQGPHSSEYPNTSSSVRIADNPQYWQFLAEQQPGSGGGVVRGRVGVVSGRGGVVSSESDYDYPTTFQTPPLVPNSTDSDIRTTDNPLYATIQ